MKWLGNLFGGCTPSLVNLFEYTRLRVIAIGIAPTVAIWAQIVFHRCIREYIFFVLDPNSHINHFHAKFCVHLVLQQELVWYIFWKVPQTQE